MRITSKYVFFYTGEDHFSNFFPSRFTVHNIQFSCGEQFIMFAKAKMFKDEEIANQILRETNPMKIKSLGRKVQGYDDSVWTARREDVTYVGLLEKYRQNDNLKQDILNTGLRELVEASKSDKVWGVGLHEDDPKIEDRANWKGLNILGKILMRVREELRVEEEVRLLFQ
ncbi:hypothetical protein HDV05_004966 [Chytridiales sp. JEL 0842]|nr:hypothetical protein HDV05_004966 [Chytridiales sp. JEL 0842]